MYIIFKGCILLFVLVVKVSIEEIFFKLLKQN